jgi:hypothetical protein
MREERGKIAVNDNDAATLNMNTDINLSTDRDRPVGVLKTSPSKTDRECPPALQNQTGRGHVPFNRNRFSFKKLRHWKS